MRAIFDDIKTGNDEMLKACKAFKERLIPAVTITPFYELNDKKYLKE